MIKGEDLKLNPTISVIIAAYNAEKYILKAIDSVLKQTFENFELIVVDDVSTDSTAAIVKSVMDPRVCLIKQSENGGGAAARNLAIEQAKGKWIAILDADDWFAPDRLEILLKVGTQYGADIVADNQWYVNSEDVDDKPYKTWFNPSKVRVKSPKLFDAAYFIKNDVMGQAGLHLGYSKPLFKREFLISEGIRYRPELRNYGEDFGIILQCLSRGAKFILYPEPLYYYLIRPDSVSNNSGVWIKYLENVCFVLESTLQEEDIRDSEIKFLLLASLEAHRSRLLYRKTVDTFKAMGFQKGLPLLVKNFRLIFSVKFRNFMSKLGVTTLRGG
ncbi:MAG: glycosyltransferase [Cyanobacteria bacterium]|jgi:succinoglycan biosynthesis protein ExoO|nr:glycosyltransferase [Cyanobacteria bacterium GSL.Bin1]